METFPELNSALAQKNQRHLLRLFWLLASGLCIFELSSETSSLVTNAGTVLITVAALIPFYLWCSGRAKGLPIFPLFSFTFVWTHALPLVSQHPVVLTYTAEDHLQASFVTASSLCLGTCLWFRFVRRLPPLAASYRALEDKKGDKLFLMFLAVGVLFNIASTGGWLFFLRGGFFSAIRAAVLGLIALSCFSLAYRLGTRSLSKHQTTLFLTLLTSYMMSYAVSLLLVGAASIFAVSTAAFTIGRKRVPLLIITVAFIVFSLLHYGKSEMRSKYWFDNTGISIQPWEYPSWYSEWLGNSFSYFDKRDSYSVQEKQSLLERSSLIQLLLLAQDNSPNRVPYLKGETYAIIPQLLVPRFLNPSKIRSHEGTYLLNIHYGRQTRKDTATTTIGWGLMNEAYANYGFIGCLGLAAALGALYGKVSQWSVGAPTLSAQSLFAVLLLTFSFQTEWSAGVYVAALFQSSTVLCIFAMLFMKKYYKHTSPHLSYSSVRWD